MKKLIYSKEDLDLILSLEMEEKDQEIERLNKENTILRQNSQYLVKQKDELEEVINKAIEYIESYNIDFKNCRFGEAPISMRELGDLLNILKGVDKEC